MRESIKSLNQFLSFLALPENFTDDSFIPGLAMQECRDDQHKLRNPGEVWLINSTIKCSCSQNMSVNCHMLNEPVCLDSSGEIRDNMETWMNWTRCIKCECMDGNMNCTRYEVNVTYGLFEVKTFQTFEQDALPLMSTDSFAACEGN